MNQLQFYDVNANARPDSGQELKVLILKDFYLEAGEWERREISQNAILIAYKVLFFNRLCG